MPWRGWGAKGLSIMQKRIFNLSFVRIRNGAIAFSYLCSMTKLCHCRFSIWWFDAHGRNTMFNLLIHLSISQEQQPFQLGSRMPVLGVSDSLRSPPHHAVYTNHKSPTNYVHILLPSTGLAHSGDHAQYIWQTRTTLIHGDFNDKQWSFVQLSICQQRLEYALLSSDLVYCSLISVYCPLYRLRYLILKTSQYAIENLGPTQGE